MSGIVLAADGYPLVHMLPRMIHTYNRCSYPLHPTDDYRGKRGHRAATSANSGGTLPPETPAIVVPHWQEFPVGAWRWCSRCTRRNALRTKTVMKRYEASLTPSSRVKTHLRHHTKVADWGRKWTTLGGRFVTQSAQTVFANQHAPGGMAWCRRGYHYVALEDMTAQQTRNKAIQECVWCYKRGLQHRTVRKHWRARTQQAADLQQLRAVVAQIAAAKRELADLRRLKEAVAQEIVAMQNQGGAPVITGQDETATPPYDILLNGEAMTGPVPSSERAVERGRSRRARRLAYST